MKFALVQSDVYQAFLDQAAAGNASAGTIIRPLRVIMPLYNEEIYFIVRADSPMNFVHEIKDARINTGPVGSGTALTTTTLYRLMFNEPLSESKASLLSNEDALLKLITDKSVDVVAIVAGQPAKLFTDMKPEVRQFIKMLKFDANHAGRQGRAENVFPGDGARQQLSESADRGHSRTRGQGVPRDLRLQPAGYAGQHVEVRAVAMPEFRDAAGIGTSEVEGGRARDARSRRGLDLLSPDGAGIAPVHCRKAEAAGQVHAREHRIGTCGEK